MNLTGIGGNMPALYAHHVFGEAVSIQLCGALAETVNNHRKQFDIGLQGPDILFFYRPYIGGGKVAKYGHRLHEISAMPFFSRALQTVKQAGSDSREYAYLLGFLCHFVLDSQCHGYINQMVREIGVSHLEIEEEFEKFLLRRAGEDPLAYPLADLIPTDEETAGVIAPFYGDQIGQAAVKQALRDLRSVKKLLTAPGPFKQGMINGALRLTFHFADLKGLMNQRKDNPACRKTNGALAEMLENAVPEAVRLAGDFDESLRTGSPLCSGFDKNFL